MGRLLRQAMNIKMIQGDDAAQEWFDSLSDKHRLELACDMVDVVKFIAAWCKAAGTAMDMLGAAFEALEVAVDNFSKELERSGIAHEGS